MTGNDDVVKTINEEAVPLDTVKPENDFNDLKQLKEVLRDKKVVGLGEATHGTKEFFEMKHRLFRFLVEELDYRLFGIEANFSECLAINDYVLHGKGNPKEGLDGIYFWTWNTEEVLELIEWMREYNEGKSDDEKLKFYGFDAQFTPGAAKAIREYLEDLDPEFLSEVYHELEALEDGEPNEEEGSDRIDGWLETAEETIKAIEERFEEKEDEYISESSEKEFELVKQHLTTLKQVYRWKEVRNNDEEDKAAFSLRDEVMAEKVSWILDHEDEEKIALWAHNEHIRKSVDDHEDYPNTRMGYEHAQEYGDDYYALGFDFGHGSFQAIPEPESDAEMELQEFEFEKVLEDTGSEVFTKVEHPVFFLDTNISTQNQVREWLEKEHRFSEIGAVLREERNENYLEYVLARDYDGMIFVEETSRAVPIDED